MEAIRSPLGRKYFTRSSPLTGAPISKNRVLRASGTICAGVGEGRNGRLYLASLRLHLKYLFFLSFLEPSGGRKRPFSSTNPTKWCRVWRVRKTSLHQPIHGRRKQRQAQLVAPCKIPFSGPHPVPARVAGFSPVDRPAPAPLGVPPSGEIAISLCSRSGSPTAPPGS